MDVQMPEMDGYEAMVAIRALEDARKRGTPTTAMTANAMTANAMTANVMAGDREKVVSAGMND